MIKVLGAFCLSISHQVFGKVIKEMAGKADVWGLFGTQAYGAPAGSAIPTALLASLAFGPQEQKQAYPTPIVQILANLLKDNAICLTQRPLLWASQVVLW